MRVCLGTLHTHTYGHGTNMEWSTDAVYLVTSAHFVCCGIRKVSVFWYRMCLL